jgi:uncharacterized protein YbaR (Trm112 family)/SAM-dependent methyltransferase
MPRAFDRDFYGLLCCPVDRGTLNFVAGVSGGANGGEEFECATCGQKFPVRRGVPVFLNADASLFEGNDFEWVHPTAEMAGLAGAARKLLRKLRPGTSVNLVARENYARLAALALGQNERPVVLVVGGAEVGRGLEEFVRDPRFTFIDSDIYFGNRVNLVADGHELPLKAGSVDVVICQAVLQHVADPARCVEEMWRVLKTGGLIYGEVPFMQQVHGGAYDFCRFSRSGCRRLFRKFEEESSGMGAGAGTVLAWSVEYFLRSFSDSAKWHRLTRRVTPLFTFWLKYFDYVFRNVRSAEDGASCSFFLGRKRETEIADRGIVRMYWANSLNAVANAASSAVTAVVAVPSETSHRMNPSRTYVNLTSRD